MPVKFRGQITETRKPPSIPMKHPISAVYTLLTSKLLLSSRVPTGPLLKLGFDFRRKKAFTPLSLQYIDPLSQLLISCSFQNKKQRQIDTEPINRRLANHLQSIQNPLCTSQPYLSDSWPSSLPSTRIPAALSAHIDSQSDKGRTSETSPAWAPALRPQRL